MQICRLTRRCHALLGSEKRRGRASGGQRCNVKDRFYRVARRVVRDVAQIELDAQVVDKTAARCLRMYTIIVERGSFKGMNKLEYVALALLYILKDGLSDSQREVVPKLELLDAAMPHICNIHLHASRDGDAVVGFKKRTLTRTIRHIIATMRLIVSAG